MKAAFYKGTRHGWRGIGNRLVRWRTHSAYSHCELVLEAKDGYPPTLTGHWCIGSSATDPIPADSPRRPGKYGGVRLSEIAVTDAAKWDLIDVPDELAGPTLARALPLLGLRYDLRGIFGFALLWTRHRPDRVHCSALIVQSIFELELAHMYHPGQVADLLRLMPRLEPE